MNDAPEGPPDSRHFIEELVDADNDAGTFGGRVQTRFPPEPNGYLHIGHAKSICLNFGLAEDHGGVCNLRFDDTNPEAEREDYVDAIVDDVAWLGYGLADGPRFASDYFERLYAWAESLIERGLAYVDDQSSREISETRGTFTSPGVPSPWRDRGVEENLTLLRAMRAGEYDDGEKVLRARIDMAHDNMSMRDPVLYRIRHVGHHRTGDDWCIYPTYDWAHGQSDAIEGVTHSLCTLEFESHRPLYDWLLAHLDLPYETPRQTEFARLKLTYTVMSKRVITRLVEQGEVQGWDDPRLPTLRGLRRRGYPPTTIRAFCDHISVARFDGTHEIELLESFVRTELNATASRRMAVLRPLKLVIDNWPDGATEMRSAVNNPEDPTAGERDVPFGGELWIERDDFMLDPPPKFYRLAPGREVRLRYGYFVTCTDVITDDEGEIVEVHCTYDPETSGGQAPDGRKVKATLHWVGASHAIDGTVALYERLFTEPYPEADGAEPVESLDAASKTLITDAKLEPALGDLSLGEVVQFERLGYFAHDLDTPGLFHRTVGLRDEWARIQARKS